MGQAATGGATVNPSEAYEQFMVPAMFAPLAAILINRAAPQTGERVLDVACGTGVVSRRIASFVGPTGQVTGLDLNPAMVAVARARAEAEGATIEWHAGSAEALPFPDHSFELVCCQQGLQFVPDRARAIAEMLRVLGPGGRVILALWQSIERHPFFLALDEAIHRHLGAHAMQAPFSLGEADALQSLLDDAGFEAVAVEPATIVARFANAAQYVGMQVSAATAAIPSLRHLDATAVRQLTDAVSTDFADTLHAATVNGDLHVPVHTHLALARRPT